MDESKIINGTGLHSDEYGEYYERYIRQLNFSELEKQLKENQKSTLNILKELDEKKALYRYKPEKWSVKEVIGHVIDTERIFNYRALALARGEQDPLVGYDHNEYVNEADFDRFSIDNLKNQYTTTRAFTLSLFQSFDRNELLKRGVVNGSEFTVRGLGFVIAGHELHHLGILKVHYL